MKVKSKLTKLEKSWILYDIGNSAFILLASTLLPIFFNAIASADGVNEEMYLSYWGYAGAIATALVSIIGPLCGTLADRPGFKKPIFLAFVLLGVISCMALGLAKSWLIFLGIYILAKVGFSSSLVFYDAMLVEVTDDEKMDQVSSAGYAYGYIGSVIPFIVCLVLVLFPELFGMTQGTAMVISFLLIGIWWLVCTLPLLCHYKQKANHQEKKPLRNTFSELGNTLRHAAKNKNILMYLIAFFFFINGVYTIMEMATAYGTALGLEMQDLLLALLLTQIIAFPSTIIFGKLATKVAAGKLMKICILCYTGVAIFAMFLVSAWQFWLLAVLVGCFQGAIQALSRSYMSRIIPAEKSGSYFGLMDICGKGAAFLGMLLVSVISQATIDLEIPKIFGLQLQNENIGVGALVILFVIGYVLFCKADRMNTSN